MDNIKENVTRQVMVTPPQKERSRVFWNIREMLEFGFKEGVLKKTEVQLT